ncbi:histidine kinase [Emticicia sp. BO119]|uniref:ligand-binding sensor domain-containing protein n=1 Tax=Emticicia sp. BO119 TaxID=2757768 RepID=UPI0015EFF9F0|nr:histidine kinase [Emticicia sp. BO119]MBA4852426.1 histidine kinase [Emticicia sp. BO119]
MFQQVFHTLLLSLFLCAVSYAQKKVSFVFSHLNESTGLPNNSIFCSLQDKDGFIWLGTADGLLRFDGSHFNVFKSNYKTNNSLSHNSVTDLFEDKDGKIWISTTYGVCYFDKKKLAFVSFLEDSVSKFGRCTSIMCDDWGNVWFAGENFICSYSKKTKKFIRYNHDPSIVGSVSSPEAFLSSIANDPVNGGIWISTFKGLNYFDIRKKRFFNYLNNPDKIPIFDDELKGIIKVIEGKLYYYDQGLKSFIIYNLKAKQIERTISCVAWKETSTLLSFLIDKNRNIWLSFFESSYYIDSTGIPKEIEYDDNKNTSIGGKYASTIWQTEDGTIWMGTATNGISYTNPDKIFYQVHSIPDIDKLTHDRKTYESINSFAEAEDKTWWMGTWTSRLIHFNPQKKTTEIFSVPIPKVANRLKYIHSVLDSKDIVYVAAQEGVFMFNKIARKFSTLTLPPKIDLKRVGTMAILLKDDFLWIRTDTSAVFSYQISQKKWREYYLPHSVKKGFFTTRFFLETDLKGDLWTNIYPEGLARFSEKKEAFILEDISNHQPFEEWFYQFKTDSSNNFWIPSLGFGLIKYDKRKKQYENWREADGLVSDYCAAVCPDEFGKIWIGSLNKFSIFDPHTNQFQNFRLPYNDTEADYRNYMFRLKNKHILTVLKNYLVEFMPEKVASAIPKSPALISSLQTPDSTFLINSEIREITLNATQNNFSICYSVLTPYHEQYKYYYKLEGYDENWVAADSKTTANYTKIPGGKYEFKVKTVMNNKFIESKMLIIEVDTFFYKTQWFLYLVLSLIGGLSFAFYRYNVQKTAEVHHLQIQTARLQKDKTEIQYQNLINHLNPHFLFNSLTSLNSLITINPKQASKFLKRLSLIYRYILQNKEKELVSLDEEIAFVQNYIDLQKSRFEEGLQVSIQIPEEYSMLRIVPVTLQNLLENAIKHNIIEDEIPLVIFIYGKDDYLIVENNLQKKHYVETSNKQGLTSLQTLYYYLSNRKLEIIETNEKFIVRIPLL